MVLDRDYLLVILKLLWLTYCYYNQRNQRKAQPRVAEFLCVNL